ncbi:hypothetical protein SLNWT_5202 [Streptomyces albus]|uniref:Restriction endonuclease type IV Mrr domain-containing protein n=1 Tax=Streptomyces albus (strain ATCC 21838 / DSM 41398 / FERM P-419 / JCM 4703 / NBRC 107858) TaxID=1081613 RepID=A0A0B5ERX9_STRA4|nr:hypothetical protein SLNWT_5202 [Streptomyces albus]AOU79881.1 hypothetical protein SLNHY_5190 [Streptomyces albus]AYN35601.1 hypothetical protein DUI70_5103 [Streptomyces albus]
MLKDSSLRGYLLEESLAWLLRRSGYRLLVHENQDPVELISEGDTLRVRGRGALHQVDVLGEFTFTPAFSMPVRLFLEAKYEQKPCGLEKVRNAHGVLHDVNENFMTGPETRPRQRYTYSYALFSASGFTANAQKYALAHQISLVDLSGASFTWLLGHIGTTVQSLFKAQQYLPQGVSFPVNWMRAELRRALGTSPLHLLPQAVVPDGRFRRAASAALAEYSEVLCSRSAVELLLGFPSAPFVLPLATDDHERFLQYAEARPDHTVRIKRRGTGGSAEWTLSPADEVGAYELAFKLPEHIEDWISGVEGKERRRTVEIKEQFLSMITLYRVDGAGVRTYRLRYEAGSLSRAGAPLP